MKISRLNRLIAATLVVLALSLSLSGCGNKGPLFLPPENTEAAQNQSDIEPEKKKKTEKESE